LRRKKTEDSEGSRQNSPKGGESTKKDAHISWENRVLRSRRRKKKKKGPEEHPPDT